ncbi:MAG: hypothetical protein P4L50_17320 [Anaerolineaceae bacterium]|nr:hypothetical protein [Anaerolineaceae bacterium]
MIQKGNDNSMMLADHENKSRVDGLQKFIRNRNFPIIVILLSGLILGFSIFSNFGISWDEPNFYIYGQTNWQAYSQPLAGTYQAYLKQNPDGLHYGQPFVVVGEAFHALFSLIFPHALSIDLWHLITYLSFLLGVFFFYKLAQRWFSMAAATISTLLFASQPVLFGLAWIDPKDIPFMVFFLGSIYLGLIFSDHASLVFGNELRIKQNEQIYAAQKLGIHAKWEKVTFTASIFLCGFSLILVIGAGVIRKWIGSAILSVNLNNPISLLDKLFIEFAHNAQNLPLINYSNKITDIFDDSLVWFSAVAVLSALVILYFIGKSLFFKNHFPHFEKFLREFKKDFTNYPQKKAVVLSFIGACLFVGLASATRIVGPFAALLIVWILAVTLRKKSIPVILFYGLVSFIVFYLLWPYLWQNPLHNIIHSIQVGVDFQGRHTVLFGGAQYDSMALPASYLPTLLVISLTEPAILFILMGMIISVYRYIKKKICKREIFIPFLWFFLPFLYVVITTPNLYDNYRQLSFILPGAFLFSAFSIDFICQKINRFWINSLIIIVVLFPGVLADVQLHPYQYAYYNSLVGGVKGAAYRYDVDYWLTCYKDLTQQINANEKGRLTVYVGFNDDLVETYANKNIIVKPTGTKAYPPGSLIVLPLRSNAELSFPNYPVAYSVKLNSVDLCVAKRVQ